MKQTENHADKLVFWYYFGAKAAKTVRRFSALDFCHFKKTCSGYF